MEHSFWQWFMGGLRKVIQPLSRPDSSSETAVKLHQQLFFNAPLYEMGQKLLICHRKYLQGLIDLYLFHALKMMHTQHKALIYIYFF